MCDEAREEVAYQKEDKAWLLGSSNLLLAGMSITDAEEILWQVDGALLNLERSIVLMSNIVGVGPTGE